MRIPKREKPCTLCGGSGRLTVIDGADLRFLREKVGLSLRRLAALARPPLSAAYLSDVELGRRSVSPRVRMLYEKMVNIEHLRRERE